MNNDNVIIHQQANNKIVTVTNNYNCLKLSVVIFYVVLSLINIILGFSDTNITICTHEKTTNFTFSNNSIDVEIEKIAPTVNLNIWLIVNGFMLLTTTLFITTYYLNKNNSQCLVEYNGLIVSIILMFELFLVIWVILGIISVWKDCGNNINQITQIFVLITTICESIRIILVISWLIVIFFDKFVRMLGYIKPNDLPKLNGVAYV